MRSRIALAVALGLGLVHGTASAQPEDPGWSADSAEQGGAQTKPMFLFGLEVGVGGALGKGTFKPGFGRAVYVGVRWSRYSIEWHLLERYDAPPEPGLVSATTGTTLGLSSLGMRVELARHVAVYAGMAHGSSPAITPRTSNGRTDFTIDTVDGLGPIGGVIVGFTSRNMSIGIAGRLAKMLVSEVTPPHVVPTGPRMADGTVPIELDTTPIEPAIVTLSANFRVMF